MLFICSEETISVRMQLGELGVDLATPTTIYCDNLAAVALANNPSRVHHRTKALDLKLHKIREWVLDGLIAILPVRSEDNIADLGTKPLPRPAFRKHASVTIVPFIPPS